MMRRRTFIASTVSVLAAPLAVEAQQSLAPIESACSRLQRHPLPPTLIRHGTFAKACLPSAIRRAAPS